MITLFLQVETRRKEKKIKEKESREKDNSLLSFDKYEKLFPYKDVNKSLSKYLNYADSPTHDGALEWLKNEKNKKKHQFRKSPTGCFIAYCSKCGDKQMPNNEWQIIEGSSCHHVEYVPERIKQVV